ncbi:haloacid dehalogenase-like hydrolase domain-containing protein Sgpp [Triticum urartu]|nr:haloacid dehalogenase-like hydrolase domain-containing protein Sgpp [Triticum urartu]
MEKVPGWLLCSTETDLAGDLTDRSDPTLSVRPCYKTSHRPSPRLPNSSIDLPSARVLHSATTIENKRTHGGGRDLSPPPPPPPPPLASTNGGFASPLAATVPVEAVLFDIDGTLCDSDPLHHIAFQELLLAIGYNNGVPIDDEFFINNIAGRSDAEAAQNLFPDWPLEKGLKFLEDKDVKYRSLAMERLEPVKGLHKVVQWVKDHGYKRAAVTNAPRINAELMIKLLGLSDFFQAVIVGGECEQPKPAPFPYLKALKELEVSAAHTFIFEDSASGTRAGVAAGMPVVAVSTRNPEKSLQEAGAALIISDYEDQKLWNALEEIDSQEAKLKTGGA